MDSEYVVGELFGIESGSSEPRPSEPRISAPAETDNGPIKIGVAGVIGHICSSSTEAALNIYKNYNIPVISSSATTPSLTLDGAYPNFFRTIPNDNAQGKLAAGFASGTLGLKDLVILTDGGSYGNSFAMVCADYLTASGVGAMILSVEIGASDYSDLIRQVKQSGPDGIVFGGYSEEAAVLVAEMERQNLNVPFIAGDGVKDNNFLFSAGDAAKNVYVTAPMDFDSNPMFSNAKEEHVMTYGEGYGAFYLNGYAATQALANAIEKAGSDDPAEIISMLRRESVDTPLGRIGFDINGDMTGCGFAVYHVRNGRFVEY